MQSLTSSWDGETFIYGVRRLNNDDDDNEEEQNDNDNENDDAINSLDHGQSNNFDMTDIVQLQITEHIQDIPDFMFKDCYNLLTIVVMTTSTESSSSTASSYKLRRIGHGTFSNCRQLMTITIPSTIEEIDDYAFIGCSQLELIIFDAAVGSINNNNTTANNNWKLRRIGNYAFQNCISLESIIIPYTIRSLGIGVFNNCTSLGYVQFLSNEEEGQQQQDEDANEISTKKSSFLLEEIPFGAFQNCISLMSIELPTSIQRINDHAFEDCSALMTVHMTAGTTTANTPNDDGTMNPLLSSSLHTIGHSAFLRCSSLQYVDFLSLSSSASSDTNDENINCSANVIAPIHTIGEKAFSGCINLSSISLPISLLYVSTNSFDFDSFLRNNNNTNNNNGTIHLANHGMITSTTTRTTTTANIKLQLIFFCDVNNGGRQFYINNMFISKDDTTTTTNKTTKKSRQDHDDDHHHCHHPLSLWSLILHRTLNTMKFNSIDQPVRLEYDDDDNNNNNGNIATIEQEDDAEQCFLNYYCKNENIRRISVTYHLLLNGLACNLH